MKSLYNFFNAFIILFLLFAAPSFAVQPACDMRIKNVTVHTNPISGADSILTFDLYIQWTNSGVSDPFEFAASEGAVFINHEVFNGGILYGSGNAGSFGKILGSSELSNGNTITCVTAFYDSDRDLLLWFEPILPSTENFIVSTSYPGTRILTFKLRTNAHSWSPIAPNLKFKYHYPPVAPTTFAGYFAPPVDPEDPERQLIFALTDTIENHFLTENDFPLPVELQFFTSSVNRNIVTLSWSTSLESNNYGFDIERKNGGSNEWSTVGFLPGNGTTHITSYYNFTQRINTGNYNYRLKQIDYNSNYTYYNLINVVKIGVPSPYMLSQNYPNPFNPVTKIDYELPDDAKVRILLYDLTGKEISSLLNESKTAGYYTLKFDATDFPSGMYIYKMIAEGKDQNFTETKKMLIIK